MNRKEERQRIIKILYQYDFNPFKEDNLDFILENYQLNSKFIKKSIISILKNIDDIDSIIIENIRNNTINTLLPIEKAILRVAVNEFVVQKSIPTSVSINEAVENAKIYSNDESYKLINGILSSIAKKYSEN